MKYNILIVAVMDSEDMVLYSEVCNVCRFSYNNTFEQLLRANFPLLSWLHDDGEDFDEDEDTKYCQYVFYPDDKDTSRYILATFQATND